MARKTPMRKCVACGENKPKVELLRIVNNKEEGIKLDPTGKLNGRGAYVCKDVKCIKTSEEKNKLARSLRAQVPDEIYKEINDYVDEDL